MLQYLVVETATLVEVLEERSVGFATPKVQIGNLKIAPNYFTAMPHNNNDKKSLLSRERFLEGKKDVQWQRL